MPLGSPQLLNTFFLGGYQLQANAPESVQFSSKAAFRFFFFKNGPTKVQKGRVIPQPITFSFKLNGPQALNAAMFLHQMKCEQKPVKFSWAKTFAFDGYLTEFSFNFTQKVVSGTLTYQPTANYLRHDDSTGLTAAFASSEPVITNAMLAGFIGGVLGALQEARDMVETMQASINEAFGPVFAVIDAANEAVSLIQETVSTFGDIISVPFQTANELWEVTNDAIDLLPGAVGYIKNAILSPTIPILQGTPADLSEGHALKALAALDDVETNLLLCANAVKQPAGSYEVQDGDSLDYISDLFEVAIGDILALNPGLTAATLTPGKVLKVPQNGTSG